MSEKTDEQIDTEVQRLIELKPRVRQYSGFGEDNHAAIEAQIATLRERMDWEEIHDHFDHSDHELTNALEAHDWMNGDDGVCTPSLEWRTLVK